MASDTVQPDVQGMSCEVAGGACAGSGALGEVFAVAFTMACQAAAALMRADQGKLGVSGVIEPRGRGECTLVVAFGAVASEFVLVHVEMAARTL